MINPVGALLLIEPEEKGDTTTASGLVISAAFADDNLKYGKVVAMGPGEPNALNGELIPIGSIKVGDKVAFPKHTGSDIEENNNKFILLHSKQILAVITE